MSHILADYALPCLWAFLACVGFGLVFNIQGAGILICGVGAGLGWLVYLLAMDVLGSDITAAFLAAVDTLARSISSAQIPVSALTAVIGAPFFIALVRKTGGWRL